MAENNVFNNEEVTEVPETPTPQTDITPQTPTVDELAEKPNVDAPAEGSAADTPVEEPAAETPSEEPVADTPVEELAAETPDEEPVEETSLDAPVSEAPENELVMDAPVMSPEEAEPEKALEFANGEPKKKKRAPSSDGADSRAMYLDQPVRSGDKREAPKFEDDKKGINGIPDFEYVEELRKRGAPVFAEYANPVFAEDTSTDDSIANANDMLAQLSERPGMTPQEFFGDEDSVRTDSNYTDYFAGMYADGMNNVAPGFIEGYGEGAYASDIISEWLQIGRASCRERVCLSV